MRPIDADACGIALAEYLTDDRAGNLTHEEIINNEALVDALRVVYEMPTLDVAPVRHGKWIHRWSGCGSTWLEQKCSVCGVVFEDEPNDYSYCPHCGARMDAE